MADATLDHLREQLSSQAQALLRLRCSGLYMYVHANAHTQLCTCMHAHAHTHTHTFHPLASCLRPHMREEPSLGQARRQWRGRERERV